jgi:hypothetical protein
VPPLHCCPNEQQCTYIDANPKNQSIQLVRQQKSMGANGRQTPFF